MKRLICLIAALVLLVSTSGCGRDTVTGVSGQSADGGEGEVLNTMNPDREYIFTLIGSTDPEPLGGLESPNVRALDEGTGYAVTGDYAGEYSLTDFSPEEKDYDRYSIRKGSVLAGCLSFEEYTQYCLEEGFTPEYTDESMKYAVIEIPYLGVNLFEMRFADVLVRDGTAFILLYINEEKDPDFVEQQLYIKAYSLVVPLGEGVTELKYVRIEASE